MAVTNPILRDTPFNDSDGDGRIVLSPATCASLGVPEGTVLLPDGMVGTKYRYWIEGLPRTQVETPNVAPPTSTDRSRNSGSFLTTDVVAGPFNVSTVSICYRQRANVTLQSVEMRDFTMVDTGILYRKDGGVLDKLLIERVKSDPGKYYPSNGRGIFLGFGQTNNATIRDIRFYSDDPVTSSGDIYPAIALAGKSAADFGANFLFEDLDLDGFQTAYPAGSTAYPNCDGISIEKGYTDGVIRRAHIARTADAAIDIKGLRWRIEHLTTVDCVRGIKRWSAGKDGPIRTINPGSCHVMSVVPPAEGEWVIDHWEPVGTDPRRPLVQFETHPGTVRVLSWEPSGIDLTTQVFARRGEVTSGQCRLILPDREIVV